MEASELELVPCDLRLVWPQIEAKLLPWLFNVPGGVTELFQEIDEGRTTCWRSCDAVFVLSLVPAPAGLSLFVRAMASPGVTTTAIGDHMPALHKMARELKATTIRFRSPRAGWLRALPEDWRVSHVEYFVKVEP
jgi:hypothetical protein